MNKFIAAFPALMLLLSSCTESHKPAEPAPLNDTVAGQADTASVDTMEQLIAEAPMPKAADELFDDFFFNFAANRRLQAERIQYPLPVTAAGMTTTIGKGEWKTDHFFMRQGYYTLIFDNARQMDVVKDTSVSHVVVEKIYLKRKTVKQYVFDRVNGLWMMKAIEVTPIGQNANASFLSFYQRFATDSAYQVSHLCEQVQFVGPDSDDDFSEMSGLLTPDTWPAFAPQLPTGMIYNIVYGDSGAAGGGKVFVLRGISNGMEVELSFKRIGKKWMLTKLST